MIDCALFKELEHARVLRDIGILRIVDDAAPASERDADLASRGIPRWRFALERRERTRDASSGGRHCDNSPVALHFEEHAGVAGQPWSVRVARERRQLRRAAACDRHGPEIDGAIDSAGPVGRTHIDDVAVGRKRDRPVHVEIGIHGDRAAAARDGDTRSAVLGCDARNLATRRPRGKGDALADLLRHGRRTVGGNGPQLLSLARVDDRGDEAARRRPGELTQVGDRRGRRRRAGTFELRAQRIVIFPEAAARALRDVVERPAALRPVAVGDHRVAVGAPQEMSNLRLAWRQIDKRSTIDRAHAEESPLRVRDRQTIGCNRAGGVAIADRPELMRVGHPGESTSLRRIRPSEPAHGEREDGGRDERNDDSASVHAPIVAGQAGVRLGSGTNYTRGIVLGRRAGIGAVGHDLQVVPRQQAAREFQQPGRRIDPMRVEYVAASFFR